MKSKLQKDLLMEIELENEEVDEIIKQDNPIELINYMDSIIKTNLMNDENMYRGRIEFDICVGNIEYAKKLHAMITEEWDINSYTVGVGVGMSYLTDSEDEDEE